MSMTDPMTDHLLIDNPRACGLGEGARCCAFLVAGSAGFECARVMDRVRETIRGRLAEGSMNAQYDPGDVPFPRCQEER